MLPLPTTFQHNTKLCLSTPWDLLCFPMSTLVIAKILSHARQRYKDVEQEHILEMQELMGLKLSKSSRILMQVTQRPSVSSVQMQLEVQLRMTTG